MRVWLIQDGEPLPCINKGAREMRCASLAGALAKSGTDVLWWASTFDHSSKKHLFTEAKTINPSPRFNVRLLHGPGYSHNQSFARFSHQRSLARAFTQDAENFVLPDVIVANIPFPELAEQAIVFGEKHGIPVIVFVEDSWPDIYLTMAPKWARWFFRVILRSEFARIKKIFSSATAIYAVSNTYLEWALRYAGREKKELDGVFPLGYPPPSENNLAIRSDVWTRYGVNPNKVIVTFAGVFGFSYDLETVVRAAQVLKESGDSRVHFVLIGDGDSAKSLRELASGLHNITFLGWLGHQSLYDILTCSDIGLAAYHVRATQTLPYKPFEYMAAGLPLLSSLPGELSELIFTEKIGASYEACDVQSLVWAIRNLISSPKELEEMRQRSRKLFDSRFSTDVICPAVIRKIMAVAGCSGL